MPDTEQILRSILDRWKAGIDAHEPHQVAGVFTEDAISRGYIRTASDNMELPTTTTLSRAA